MNSQDSELIYIDDQEEIREMVKQALLETEPSGGPSEAQIEESYDYYLRKEAEKAKGKLSEEER